MDNRKLYELIIKMKKSDLKATFEIITEFENIINSECYVDNMFNLECRDHIIEHLIKNLKKFKKF